MTDTAGWSTPETVPTCKSCNKGRVVSGYQIAENAGPPFLIRMYESPNAPQELNRNGPYSGINVLGGGNRASYHPGRTSSAINMNGSDAAVTGQANLTTASGEALSYTEWLVKYKCAATALGALPPCNSVPATMP